MKIRYNMLEDFVLKYSWSALGYVAASLPTFLPAWGGLGGLLELDAPSPGHGGRERDRMKAFITNKRLMLSLADAGGRMMYSIKDLAVLAGHTSRVYSLVSTLHRVHSHAYSSNRPELFSLADIQGTLHHGFYGIRLEGVPVVAPGLWPHGGEEIVDDVDVLLRPGDHMLISGPNGAGKSSIARVLAGLWPVYRGLVSRPRSSSNAGRRAEPVAGEGGVMFLPQKPYLAQGTLRDQVIYPHTEADMGACAMTDLDLMAVLEAVRLAYLPGREGGWDTKKEWKDVLSGGEKQRISLARIIYHSPAFAVLDEPTSAVSSDVEGLLYSECKQRGITLVTLSTRASLKKFHTFQLTLDGHGGWVVERIGGEVERGEVERELDELRRRVRQVQGKKERLGAVKEELARVWVHGGTELGSDVSEEVAITASGESEMGGSFAEVKVAKPLKTGTASDGVEEEKEKANDPSTPGTSESLADVAISKIGESYAYVAAPSMRSETPNTAGSDDSSPGAGAEARESAVSTAAAAAEAEAKDGESCTDAVKTQ